MDKTDFAIRMKMYEGFETNRRLMPLLPVVARCDGVAFHTFCKGLKRPYDERLSAMMVETTEFLLQHFGADAAYTQSDEITLGWNQASYDTELFCGGRIQKLNSHLAGKASVRFNKLLPKFLPEKADKEPSFDCRIFNVPNLIEAANEFLWREQDAAKNSISMAARAYYSHKELMNKNGSEMQEMLFKRKINWNDYPNFFKRGTFLLRRKMLTRYTPQELERLPEKHEARLDPNLTVERSRVVRFTDLPKFSTVINRPEFLFSGEEPKAAN